MKYFFRDKEAGPNFENGMDFYAAGIVVDDVSPPFSPSPGGKDVSVLYLHPFSGVVEHCWRAFGDIEMYPCDDESKIIDYTDMDAALKRLDE